MNLLNFTEEGYVQNIWGVVIFHKFVKYRRKQKNSGSNIEAYFKTRPSPNKKSTTNQINKGNKFWNVWIGMSEKETTSTLPDNEDNCK